MNELIGPGDFDTDGRNDLPARKASDGSLWLYQDAGGGRLTTPTQVGHSWDTFDRIIGAGDVDMTYQRQRSVSIQRDRSPGRGRGAVEL